MNVIRRVVGTSCRSSLINETVKRANYSSGSICLAKPVRESAMGISVSKVKGGGGYCYGCGADVVKSQDGTVGMETVEKESGYWGTHKQLLKMAKIKNWTLCPRCKTLKNAEKRGTTLRRDATTLMAKGAMLEVFRREVSKIRSQKAIVVYCIDAVDITGTLIRTMRDYVGGNPILLAVTRCDLLPKYIMKGANTKRMKAVLSDRADVIQPADVFMCSIPPNATDPEDHAVEGIKALAAELMKHKDGQDIFVVGSANIGKSTLTDMLVKTLVQIQREDGHFAGGLDKKRATKIDTHSVTKSALPGTTLQNIRVPCFADFVEALWDTPGLVIDGSIHHFPIRNIKEIRMSRPKQIRPKFIDVPAERVTYAIVINEPNDPSPLLRIEFTPNRRTARGHERQGRGGFGAGGRAGSRAGRGPEMDETPATETTYMIWNCTIPLECNVFDIREAVKLTKNVEEQFKQNELTEQLEQQREKDIAHNEDSGPIQWNRQATPEEKAAKLDKKEQKRLAYEERIKVEQAEMGMVAWKKQQHEKREKLTEHTRTKDLMELFKVAELVCEGKVGYDMQIANLGWLAIRAPQACKVTVFAPNKGVRVNMLSAMVMPGERKAKTLTSDNKGRERRSEKSEKSGSRSGKKEMKEMPVKMRRGKEVAVKRGNVEYHRGSPASDSDSNSDSDTDEYRAGSDSESEGDGSGSDGESDSGSEDEFYKSDSDAEAFSDEDDLDKEPDDYADGEFADYFDDEYYDLADGDSDDEDKEGKWDRYTGENVGWRFDADTRWSQGRLQDGWNPIPKSELEAKEKEKQVLKESNKKEPWKNHNIDPEDYEGQDDDDFFDETPSTKGRGGRGEGRGGRGEGQGIW